MLLLPWPLAARAATLVVDPAGGGDHATIGAAVDAASDGDVIVVAPGVFDEGDVEIDRPLQIVAQDPASPPSLQSTSAGGFFLVTGGEVVLRDLVFSGTGDTTRRALVQTGGELSVQGCTFGGSSTEGLALEAGAGGAVRVEGGTLALHHTTFLDNAGTYGGHLWIGGGAAVDARHTTFDGGRSTQSGGAVSVAPDGLFSASFGTFHRNVSGNNGGAIGPYLLSATPRGGDVTVTDCVFSSNEANAGVGGLGDGGALAIDSGGSNRVERTLLCDNEAGRWGGGLFAARGNLTVVRSAFVENRLGTAGAAAGGAVRGDASITLAYVTMLDNVAGEVSPLGRAVSAGVNVTTNILEPSVFANYGPDAGEGTLFHEASLPDEVPGVVLLQAGSTLFDVGSVGDGDTSEGYDDEDPQLTQAEDPCDPTGLVPAPTSPLWDADPGETPGAVTDEDGDGFYALVDDCDDGDASIRPDADEAPADGVDQDCDGFEACFADADGDGLGENREIPSYDLDCGGFGEAPEGDGDCEGLGDGDADGDGVCDGSDVCPEGSDFDDADQDGTPDACDDCPDDAEDDCTPSTSDDTGTEDRSGGVIAADGQLPGCNCAVGGAPGGIAPGGALLLGAAVAAYRRKDRTNHRRGRAHASR